MFTTRQTILTKSSKTKCPPEDITLSEYVLSQRSLRSLEVVCGIEKDTVVTSEGVKVTSTRHDPVTVMYADERHTLALANSVPLRDLLSDRTNSGDTHTQKAGEGISTDTHYQFRRFRK